MERLIFHLDINSAFLSWEATRRVANGEEDLRLIPSVVGGDPSKRTSIVTAKSIPAKKYGINTGEPVSMAMRKCPGLVVVRGDFDLYVKCSKAFKAICKEYAPVMESFSIDEVFMDMTGTKQIYPDPIKLAHTIKDRIRDELGFTANVGIGRNKLCAKMASDFEKPDKVHTLFPDEIKSKMWPLPVGELFTCGKMNSKRLTEAGIITIGDLASASLEQLTKLVGDNYALHLHEYANGIDDDEVREEREDAKGYSAETTVEDSLTSMTDVERILLAQADIVSARLRSDDVRCSCVCVKYRTDDFVNKTHQRKIKTSTNITDEIYEVAVSLMKECWKLEPLRLIGLSLTDIDRDSFEQLSFIVDERKEKLKMLDKAMDEIRVRFGDDSVKRASVVEVSDRVNRRYRAERNNKINGKEAEE